MKTRYPTERDLMAALRARELQRAGKARAANITKRKAALPQAPACFHHLGG